jgi:hypothetical protein
MTRWLFVSLGRFVLVTLPQIWRDAPEAWQHRDFRPQ